MGVDIRLQTPVDRILYEDGEAVGIEAGGERVAAGSVVVNGDFGHAVRRLVPEAMRPRWQDRKIDDAKLSCSTFMLYLGLEGGVGDLAHHTILLSRDYERNIREITQRHPAEEPSVYVQHAGATDPTLAPDGPYQPLRARAGSRTCAAASTGRSEAPRYRRLALERLKALGLARHREPHPLRADRDAASTGATSSRSSRARPSTSRTISRRCSIFARTTASAATSTWSAAERIPAAACR